jgi:hypothetical protein
MYKLLILAFLSIPLLIGCNDATSTEKKPDYTVAKKEIRAAFNNYKSSILSKDGAKTIQYISENTVDYFEDILDKVKFADKETILGLSTADQTQILIIRRFFSKEDIFSFDGKSLYATSIDQELMGGQLNALTIGLVAVKGDKGKAQMVVDGTKTSIFFDFLKEDKEWKIDITTTLIMTTRLIEMEAKEASVSITQYLIDMLQLKGEKEREQIWKPLEVR